MWGPTDRDAAVRLQTPKTSPNHRTLLQSTCRRADFFSNRAQPWRPRRIEAETDNCSDPRFRSKGRYQDGRTSADEGAAFRAPGDGFGSSDVGVTTADGAADAANRHRSLGFRR